MLDNLCKIEPVPLCEVTHYAGYPTLEFTNPKSSDVTISPELHCRNL